MLALEQQEALPLGESPHEPRGRERGPRCHGHDAPRVRIDHDHGARIRGEVGSGALVEDGSGALDPCRELFLGDPLDVEVEREPQIVTGLGRLRIELTEDLAVRVDEEPLLPRLPSKPSFVRGFDACPADQVRGTVVGEPGLVDLASLYLADPSDEVRAQHALRIVPDALFDDLDPFELLRLLPDLEVHLFRHELGDGNGLVAVVQLRVQLLAEHLRGDVEDLGEVGERGLPLVSELVAVDADLEADPVVNEAPPLAVDDVATEGVGRHRPERVVARVPVVLRPGKDLEEPQARRERHEHERHDEGEDLESRPRPFHLEAHHPAGLGCRRRPAEDGEEDGREHRSVDGREEDDLRRVAERTLLLSEEEGHRLMEGDSAGRAESHEDGGQQG